MKDGFVADASVGVAWAAPSQSADAAARLLDEIALGRPFVVPVLWMFEVANALVVLARRRRLDPGQCARARLDLIHLHPDVDEEGTRLALGRISDLASKHGLSVYDATYLELALRRELPLASRDASLNAAARLSGLRTLL